MDVWECDLLDVQAHAKYNDKCKYLLLIIDVFSCNVRKIDLLVVALDEPECADEVSLAQLQNTGQPCFYKYLLFKLCEPK